MMKRILKIFLVTSFAATIVPIQSYAGVWQERELLERWIAQTQALTEILNEAEYSADVNRRTQLNYGALKKDIQLNVLKVKHYLTAPTVPFEDYRKQQTVTKPSLDEQVNRRRENNEERIHQK